MDSQPYFFSSSAMCFPVFRCFACIQKVANVIISDGSEFGIPFNFFAGHKAELILMAVKQKPLGIFIHQQKQHAESHLALQESTYYQNCTAIRLNCPPIIINVDSFIHIPNTGIFIWNTQ